MKIFDENDILEIDVLEIANFDDMVTLIRKMNVMLLAIDTGELIDNNPFASYDTVDLFVGWDYFYRNEFKEHSGVYADYVAKEHPQFVLYHKSVVDIILSAEPKGLKCVPVEEWNDKLLFEDEYDDDDD